MNNKREQLWKRIRWTAISIAYFSYLVVFGILPAIPPEEIRHKTQEITAAAYVPEKLMVVDANHQHAAVINDFERFKVITRAGNYFHQVKIDHENPPFSTFKKQAVLKYMASNGYGQHLHSQISVDLVSPIRLDFYGLRSIDLQTDIGLVAKYAFDPILIGWSVFVFAFGSLFLSAVTVMIIDWIIGFIGKVTPKANVSAC